MHSLRPRLNRLLVAILNGLLFIMPFFWVRRFLVSLTGAKVHRSTSIHRRLHLTTFGKIRIGKHCTINRDVFLDARKEITIGDNVTLAHECCVYTLGHNINSSIFEAKGASVVIGDNAVLFAGVKVMPGVVVGKNAVILPFSVVTKSIGESEVWGGNPAVFIKHREVENFQYCSSYFIHYGN